MKTFKGGFSFQRIPFIAIHHAEGEGGGTATVAPVAPPPVQQSDNASKEAIKQTPLEYISDGSRRTEMDDAFKRSKESEEVGAPEPKKEETVVTKPEPSKTKAAPTIPGLDMPFATPKTDDKATTDAPESIPELEEIKPHPKSKDVEGFNSLKKRSYELIQKEKAQVKKLTDTVAQLSKKLEEEKGSLQKEVDELRGYRSAVDIHADPEFQTKFSKPMNQVKDAMVSMLKDMGASEKTINEIDWENQGYLDEVADAVAKGSATKGSLFRNKLVTFIDLQNQAKEQVENAKKNWKELSGKRTAEQEANKVNFVATVDQTIDGLSKLTEKDGKPRYGFLNTIPETSEMTPQQREAVQAHNKAATEAVKRVKFYAGLDSPQDRTEIAVAAHMGALYHNAYVEMRKYADSLKGELEAIAASTGGSNSRKVGADTSESKANGKVDVSISAADALKAAFPGMS